MNAQTSKSQSKIVTVLVRYYIKKDTQINGELVPAKSVVCLVENGQGKRYTVILRRNKQHSCECDTYVKGHGKHQCYHVKDLVALENARAAACNRQQCATCPVPCSIVAECVEKEEADWQAWMQDMGRGEAKRRAEETVLDREHAPLNGNRPFNLLKVA